MFIAYPPYIKPCVLWQVMIGLGGSVDVYRHGEYGFTYIELMLF